MELNSLKGGVIKEKADQQYFTMYHWGPLLFKTKIRPEDIKALKELSQGENEVWSDNLAGIIKGEYKFDFTKINAVNINYYFDKSLQVLEPKAYSLLQHGINTCNLLDIFLMNPYPLNHHIQSQHLNFLNYLKH